MGPCFPPAPGGTLAAALPRTAAAAAARRRRAHSRFFDNLVDLVPAKYYLDSGEDKVGSVVWMPPASRPA